MVLCSALAHHHAAHALVQTRPTTKPTYAHHQPLQPPPAARPRAPRPVAGLLQTLAPPAEPTFTVGERVRVVESVLFKHVAGHKGGFDAKACEGVITRVYSEGNLSPNRPIKVDFERPSKWVGHFEPYELESCTTS